ncbi:hypothetical protein CBM2634_P20015 [Cupriavidus taiwanensis]|uniref:Uncharacterized protein n=1 Tax=Cupriavidus taiwanensis TaxID=164546 RepID=A0A375JDQ2_9BURK|nr:hypothetical protein CBM2634_P20015 [Cupriavidus taiwanensis]
MTKEALFALKTVQSKPSFTRVSDASTPAGSPAISCNFPQGPSLWGRLCGLHPLSHMHLQPLP